MVTWIYTLDLDWMIWIAMFLIKLLGFFLVCCLVVMVQVACWTFYLLTRFPVESLVSLGGCILATWYARHVWQRCKCLLSKVASYRVIPHITWNRKVLFEPLAQGGGKKIFLTSRKVNPE